MIDWNKTKREDMAIIHKIALRANELLSKDAPAAPISLLDLEMDVTACHIYNPLKLQNLLDAPDGDFGHDVFGIGRYLNRESGSLNGNFSPRYSA